MKVKDLLEKYKGEILIEIKQLSEDEVKDVVSFDLVEKDAIKDEIMNAEISTWYVEVANKVPAYATLVVLLKAKEVQTNEP